MDAYQIKLGTCGEICVCHCSNHNWIFIFTWKMGSPIWNHFTKVKKCVCELGQTVAQPHECVFSQLRAECLLCRMLVKHSGNTSNAVTHLRIHHNDIYLELLPKFRKKKKTLKRLGCRKLLDDMDCDSCDAIDVAEIQSEGDSHTTLDGSKSSNVNSNSSSSDLACYPARSEKMASVNRAVLLFIVRGMHPLSLVDSCHFTTLVKALDPRIELPCRSTLTTVLLPNLYEEAKRKLQSEIDSVDHVALTADGWTSITGDSYVTVTIHFISNQLKMLTRVLTTSFMPESHTSENLCEFLKRRVEHDWRLVGKIEAIVTDNAPNMKAAVQLGGWKHVPCFAHTLNLVVTDALKNNSKLNEIFLRCRSLVKVFKHSSKANSQLKKMAKMANLTITTLKQEVATRWNSTVIMLRSIAILSDTIAAVLVLMKRTDLLLDEEELLIIKGAIAILEPFEEATKELSSQCYPSLSKVIPMVHLLLSSMEGDLSEISEENDFFFLCLELLKSDLAENLKIRFDKIEDVPSKALTTYLDPRFKKAYFKKSSSAAENSLDRELRNVRSLRINEENLLSNVPSRTSLSPASIFRNLHKETVRKVNAQKRGGENSTVNNILVIKEYNDWPLLDSVDPLQWWKNRQSDGVMLPVVKVVKKYFCIPATSVPSEQIFSKAGLIITKQRNALKPENADMLIFLNKNV